MDLQFTLFNDALVITGAREIPGLKPRSLEIKGTDFRTAIEVIMNEATSPSFTVANKNVIIAQVPNSQATTTVTSISILSSDFTASFRSRIKFKFGQNASKVSGIRELTQSFLKILMTTPGSDAFAKGIGGGVMKILGPNVDLAASNSVITNFSISIRRAEQQLKALQSRQPRLPDEERLISADIIDAHFDAQLAGLVARVQLVTQSGKVAYTNLEL